MSATLAGFREDTLTRAGPPRPGELRDYTSRDIFQPRSWWLRRKPFPHVVAHDVLRAEVYDALDKRFRRLLALGLSETPDGDRLSRNVPGYDVYAKALETEENSPFTVLWSRAFHDTIAAACGVAATGEVHGGLHHHLPGSVGGRVHNDLNPGYFAGDADWNGINLHRASRCNYQNGRAPAGSAGRQRVRAVAVIFFLANPRWQPALGGETGLYASHRDPVNRPHVVIPPVNNSLVAFECTPYSFHCFLANRQAERNSVVLWLHRDLAEVERRWGQRAIVRWPEL